MKYCDIKRDLAVLKGSQEKRILGWVTHKKGEHAIQKIFCCFYINASNKINKVKQ